MKKIFRKNIINKNFWNRKKVLVTGHTGFKGGWLSLWLKILGAKVSGYSLDPITKRNFFQQTGLKKIFYKDYRKNIQSIKDLTNSIELTKPEIIFHLAAQPQVLESFNKPLETIKNNVIGTTNLLEIARKKRFIKAVIVITTDKVYINSNTKISFKENFSLGGDDLYSSSKASADILSLSYIKSFFKKSNCNVATVRAGNCIGGGDWTKYRILTDSVTSFLENKQLVVRNPNYKRPWQHVLEPLAGYIILAQKLYSISGSNYVGAWNFGPSTKSHLTVYQFVKFLRKKMNSLSKIKLLHLKDIREKKSLYLNSKKANSKLKWRSLLNISETLNLTADWYLANYMKKNMLDYSAAQIRKYMQLINRKDFK